MRLPLLALLARGPAHGYELKQGLEQLLGAAYPQPNVGQIYVTLGRLEKSGLIEGEEIAQSNRPNKKIYRLTDAGREALHVWFEDPTDEPRVRDEFFMKLALAPASGMADQITLINKQRRQYLNTLRDLSKLAATEDRDNRISQLLIEGAMLHLQADLDWLERCQEELE
ncbi:PadR family transcriptional regulator [Streptomyces agglomeratus]|uniref:PadR family transcriptional regulator n=1 Tax=Streptomyces agglomeratus TaxID=285458 RepID=A0A1E5PDH7_9ACTN|nr:PadR family transcriptional regulator [Streptomyces agglomeratus]OEJ27434.1 PadR family transcriptional regulator [Streptomyces agglomeratus]OEJ38510.1 PadR family transcriptional regulator [Streptomyces agglomeratus]OEJ47106.1 PadR family transcriptional regulator [Streptomyces agglomeratus]OEJ51038.1 PadR family transcriptional regulator [Streptomyces agglomeratus]OEJ58408.1 PadR family transcriptional regulator [Streptomyces agglomeratus]